MMDTIWYLIVLRLPEAVQTQLNEVRARLAPQAYRRAVAHLTVVPPFQLKVPEAEFTTVVGRIAAGYLAVPLRILGVDFDFPQPHHVVLGVEREPSLLTFVDHLKADVEPLIDYRYGDLGRDHYLPHVTIMKTREEVERQRVSQALNQRFADQTFIPEGLLLWKLIGENQSEYWRETEQYPFSRV